MQAGRVQRTFAGFVVDAIEAAVRSERSRGNGRVQIDRWTRTSSGTEILTKAGLHPCETTRTRMRELVLRYARSEEQLTRRALLSGLSVAA
ncbi:hypothetical protein ATO11_10465 [Pseudaestuariivita atlantica]|uniref:Uncharacterized protein n=2 Tax=Pseudaestuariivita atlantica TaxID=1317121 RepID=A0A0L1JQC3_9RHOB|nr:hypothetical protein ATO11_10465 [Pseudaestuariivita atlantica]